MTEHNIESSRKVLVKNKIKTLFQDNQHTFNSNQ